MVRTLVLAVVTLGVLALAAHDTYADCGQWYPFYGYRQPNYLAQPSVVYVQPAAPQAWTTYYAPAPGAVVPAPTVVPQYYYCTAVQHGRGLASLLRVSPAKPELEGPSGHEVED